MLSKDHVSSNFNPVTVYYQLKSMETPLLNMLHKMFVHIISIRLCLDQMRIGQKRNNSVGKTKYLTGNFQQHLFVAFDFDNIYHYQENAKQFKPERNQKKDIRSVIYTRNTTYCVSQLAFCFARLKHAQNFSLKH